MKKLFLDTARFDKNALLLGMSELVLQENAARAVAIEIEKRLEKGSKIVALCGSGNNASDAIAALRILQGDYECSALLLYENLNQNAKTQLKIAQNVGVKVLSVAKLGEYECIIDGIFGTGLKRELEPRVAGVIEEANSVRALKIAVDIPSGLGESGEIFGAIFRADVSVCMGCLKLGLYADLAKDFVGEIVLAGLGINGELFSFGKSDFLLDFDDLELPSRAVKNSNKGDFGHAFIASGEMSGAARLCARAALKMGAGRVSVVGLTGELRLGSELMAKRDFRGASAVAFGMGLGATKMPYNEILGLPCVVDADAFYAEYIKDFVSSKEAILTPHPKEFSSLLQICGLSHEIDIQKNRFLLAREFSSRFSATLILKGANVIIAKDGVLYIAPKGSSKLSVGGSGDVLSGIILGFLAQGYTPLKAAINGVLAHQKTTFDYRGNDYSFTPNDIIKGLSWL